MRFGFCYRCQQDAVHRSELGMLRSREYSTLYLVDYSRSLFSVSRTIAGPAGPAALLTCYYSNYHEARQLTELLVSPRQTVYDRLLVD